MGEIDLQRLLAQAGVAPWRVALARWVESTAVQRWLIAVILFNALLLGLETEAALMAGPAGPWLKGLDVACLVVFSIELLLKLLAYRGAFFRSGWNVFDLLVVAIAVVPGAGPFAVLRALRVLRVLRLLTVIPQLRLVVAAFLHAIPGLGAVIAIMAIVFYTAGVLATSLFGATHPQWFGSLGASLYTLFQVMTLESWSMGIARPVMEAHPAAWLFFIPFIVIATFTILNLFVGIIVSTMQELSKKAESAATTATAAPAAVPSAELARLQATLERLESELARLRAQLPPR